MILDLIFKYMHDFRLPDKKKKHPFAMLDCFFDDRIFLFHIFRPVGSSLFSDLSVLSTENRPDSVAERSFSFMP